MKPMVGMVILLLLVLLNQLISVADAQSTAFTYQGRLNNAGSPANGVYDFVFTIFDASTNGNQMGPAVTNLATTVNDGLFSAVLDFGNQFPGANRWLQIGVRTNNGGAFATLIPRQLITPTPYAITAGSVLPGGILAGIYTNAIVFNNASNQFFGSGAGLTNLNMSALAGGTLPLAQLSSLVVTNWSFVTPLEFGAVGDGTTDDTAAFSDAVAAINANQIRVMDLAGRTYFVRSGFAFTPPNIEIKNGSIVVPDNFTGAVLTRSTTGGSSKGNANFHDLTIGRQGTTAPDPSTVGIQTGVYNTSYRNDVTIHDCEISNFWRAIMVENTPQFQIWHNRTGFSWSNQVYVASQSSKPGTSGEGGDESSIAFNDINYIDMAAGIPSIDQSIYHNQIAIQLDATCIDLAIDYNNAAGFKQFVKTSPLCGSGLEFRGNEIEQLYSTSSNICAVEIWNSIVHWDNCKIAGINGAFGGSNYLAAIGLYATNGSHLNFARCSFKGDFGEGSGNLFDIWSADGFFYPIDGYATPLVLTGNPGSVRWHNTFGDVGTVIGASEPFDTYPWSYNVTNAFLGTPWGGVTTIGAPNALQVINENGVGPYAQFFNSPIFSTGATFGDGPALYNIYDRNGGQGFMRIWSEFENDSKFASSSSGNADMEFKKGTITAWSNIVVKAGEQTAQPTAATFNWGSVPVYSASVTNYYIGAWTNGCYVAIYSNTASSYVIKQLAP